MGWRKMMSRETADTNSNPKSNRSNIRNIQENNPVKANIADIAPMVQKVKSPQQKYDALWKKAWALADWIDDSGSDVPWQERTAKVPELQGMSMMLVELELLINQ